MTSSNRIEVVTLVQRRKSQEIDGLLPYGQDRF